MSPVEKNISVAITRLAMDVGQYGPLTLEFDGQTIEVNKRLILALRAREDLRIARAAKGGKKSSPVSSEQRSDLIAELRERVSTALTRMEGVKVSSQLRDALSDGVTHHLQHRRDAPSQATFVPRLLFYLDEHFVEFLDGIPLKLFASYFEGKGTPSLRRDLTTLEKGFVSFLRETQVGASTVLNALVTLYITSQNLRETSPEYKGMIRVDDRLRRFLNTPMDSRMGGRSYSSSYEATRRTKTTAVSGREAEVITLAGYRQDHPNRSVMDYIRETCPDHSYLAKGYIRGADVMSLVSAHLISHRTVDPDMRDALSMTTDSRGHYVNPKVYTLISLQAIVSATNGGEEGVSAAVAPVARSPSRSPARSPSRSPTRASSRGRPQ